MPSKRIVVGVSGSPGSLQALRFALDHARALDADLVPVIAWEPPGGDSVARPYPGSVTDAWADAAEERLLQAFDEGLGASPLDLPAASHVIRGRPGHVLVTVAGRPDDLLVVGKGRPTMLRRAAGYGPVTRHCLTHATCPVITVPPTPLAADATRTLRGLRLRRAPRDGGTVLERW